jgi:hypothetical protein
MSASHLAHRLKKSHGFEQLSLLRSFPFHSLVLSSLNHHADLSMSIEFSAWHAVRGRVASYTAWALLVWVLDKKGLAPGVTSAGGLVGVLSMVTGMLVGFRMSSSYDRVRFLSLFLPFSDPFLTSTPSMAVVRRSPHLGLNSKHDPHLPPRPHFRPPRSVLPPFNPRRRPRNGDSRTRQPRLRLPLRVHVSPP